MHNYAGRLAPGGVEPWAASGGENRRARWRDLGRLRSQAVRLAAFLSLTRALVAARSGAGDRPGGDSRAGELWGGILTALTPGPAGIFISYRREDAAYPAGWLYDELTRHFGKDRLFKDVDSIRPGDDFVEKINIAVGSCAVLLAVIGKRWLIVTDTEGRRRLDDPDDIVRLEIEAALTRGVRVIPVLVDGSQMPRAAELPTSLEKLARIQAIGVSPDRFNSDANRLLGVLAAVLDTTAVRPTEEPARVVRDGGDGLADMLPADSDSLSRSEIGPYNRGWVLTAFLLPFSLSGAFVVPLLLFKRDRAVLLNVILSLGITLLAVPGIICGIFGSRSVGEHSSIMLSASLWIAAVVLCAPSAVALIYCLIKVARYRQPEIPWFTRNARRLTTILWPAPPDA
jgi:hypothetical protein